jgi:hypothetical protein
MFKHSLVITKVIVPPNKLHIYEDYVKQKIYELSGKNFSYEIGYINKVIDIIKIQVLDIVKEDFSGNLIYEVTFLVENCNPEINEEIECHIIQNGDILFGLNGPLKIIIIKKNEMLDLEIKDKVLINIKLKEISYLENNIKIVGEFIKKLN